MTRPFFCFLDGLLTMYVYMLNISTFLFPSSHLRFFPFPLSTAWLQMRLFLFSIRGRGRQQQSNLPDLYTYTTRLLAHLVLVSDGNGPTKCLERPVPNHKVFTKVFAATSRPVGKAMVLVVVSDRSTERKEFRPHEIDQPVIITTVIDGVFR